MNKRLKKKLDQSLISSNKSTVVSLANSHIVDIIGINNENLEYAEEHLSVQILQKGNIIIIKGNKKDRYVLRDTIIQLSEELKVPNLKYKNSFKEILNMKIKNDKENQNIKNLTVAKTTRTSVTGKTPQQNQYLEALYSKQIVFGVGPAGTGKTYTSVALAVKALKEKQVKKIILTRPAVEAGENLGFLPGDMKEKLDPYMQPLYDALRDMIPAERLNSYLEKGTIQIAPLAFMRGRTLDHAFVILDEAQNTTHAQMKMFLTRMGTHAKFIITGDPGQIDLPRRTISGLKEALLVLKETDGIGMIYLDDKDVIRHKLVRKVIEAYKNIEHTN